MLVVGDPRLYSLADGRRSHAAYVIDPVTEGLSGLLDGHILGTGRTVLGLAGDRVFPDDLPASARRGGSVELGSATEDGRGLLAWRHSGDVSGTGRKLT